MDEKNNKPSNFVESAKIKSSTPYDDVFRTMLNDCGNLLIPVVNEMFHENYTGKEIINFFPNEHFINQQDGRENERITDSCFEIVGNTTKKYMIECQCKPDSSMLIRICEYAMQVALDQGKLRGNTLTVTIPHCAVLYLKRNKKASDLSHIKIVAPDGSFINIDVSAIKMQKYSLKEIFEKNLLFFLPFYIFVYDGRLKEYNNNEEKLASLKQEFSKISEKLELMADSDQISEYQHRMILDMSNKVVVNYAKRYKNIKEGVGEIMGGKILEYEAKDIYKEGYKTGQIKQRENDIRNLYEKCASIQFVADVFNLNGDEVTRIIQSTPCT